MRASSSRHICTFIICSWVILFATPATANERWGQNHPRRAEANARLGYQDRRIHQERREGEINRAQAVNIHKQVRQIRREEH
ncbi:MAG TPA: hypothetical protein VIF10_12890 [Methylobacter sp.]|jgi:hypothetical protein